MSRWRVRDVTTTEAITMPYDAPFTETAAAPARHRSSDGNEYATNGGFDGDIVDEWGRQSFPASDPPSNW